MNNVTSIGGGFPIEKAVSGEKQSPRMHGRADGVAIDQPTDVVQTPRESGVRRRSLRELMPDSFRHKRLTKFEGFIGRKLHGFMPNCKLLP